MTSQPDRYKKTRIAPTPSGFLHLGNVLSFSITAALARRHGAKILLRIDDLDRPRVNKEYVQDIFDTLNFLDIPWDDGPRDVKDFDDNYSQIHKMSLYHNAIKQLGDNKLVFACTCTRSKLNGKGYACPCRDKEIPFTEKDTTLRLVTGNNELMIKNYSGNSMTVKLPANMHDFVIRRRDGIPSYQLTSVIDDLLYGIDLVIRGEDLLPSTIAQHELASALDAVNFRDITFYHHPLLTDAAGEKLSKSAGSISVRYLRANGNSSSRIYTLIASMLAIKETINNWEQLASCFLIAGIKGFD
jgi:glutamyl/glutaminyl-tRNA synthetase